MNYHALAAEIVRKVQHSPDTPINLETQLQTMLGEAFEQSKGQLVTDYRNLAETVRYKDRALDDIFDALDNYAREHPDLISAAQAVMKDWNRIRIKLANLEQRVRQVKIEINCRIEHGADSNGHLEYVEQALEKALASLATTV